MLGIFDGFVIASTACLDYIIMIFGISFEGYFCVAVGAFEIEPKDFNAEIGLFVTYFHSHVEFSSDVKVIGAGVAP